MEDVGRLFQPAPGQNFRMAAQRILGLMLMIFSLTIAARRSPFPYCGRPLGALPGPAAIIASAGLLLWMPARKIRTATMRLRDGF